MGKHNGRGTYGDNLRSNKRKSSLGYDAPISDKPTGGSRNTIVLNEGTGVFPVTESDSETNVRIFSIPPGVKPRLL